MKIDCHRPSLASALQIVSGVVPSRTPRDILKNVHLTATPDSVTLVGTNEQVGIRYEIPGVEVQTPGETLLPTSRVISILREMTDDRVTIELADDAAWIRSGHSEFRLSAQDATEFPPVPEFAEESNFEVEGTALSQAIRRTIFATDVESTRYALGGILAELEGEKLTLVATDSRRLAVATTACSGADADSLENSTPVIPREAMSLIEKSIAEDDTVRIAIQANDVLIRTAHSTIYSRLVDGRFPRYKDVVPKESTHTIDLVVGPLYSAVRQAQIVTTEESRGVDFTFAEGMMTLNSESADVGRSKIELPISYDGEEITITFDPRFLADFLRVLEPERSVQLHLTDAESAAVLRVDDNYTYVIMPLSRNQ